MIRIGIALAVVALVGVALWRAAVWIRADAQVDILRELQIKQIERTDQDIKEQKARKKEIENATPDELWRRACDGGMLPPYACGEAGP